MYVGKFCREFTMYYSKLQQTRKHLKPSTIYPATMYIMIGHQTVMAHKLIHEVKGGADINDLHLAHYNEVITCYIYREYNTILCPQYDYNNSNQWINLSTC